VYRRWMTARRSTAIASTAVAASFAVALATSSRAETADPSKQTATTTSRAAAGTHPLGVVLDCSTQSGRGGAPGGTFTSRWNLVVGPLAMRGAGGTPVHYSNDFGGNKFPLIVRGGHRVTIAVPRSARPGVGLTYVPLRKARRVITFSACRRDEMTRNPYEPHTACCFSFWAGGVLAPSPRCVPLLVWADDERSPRRAVIHLGVPDCG
jgi:hypothetical protein